MQTIEQVLDRLEAQTIPGVKFIREENGMFREICLACNQTILKAQVVIDPVTNKLGVHLLITGGHQH